jgi:leucyl aminopeptidase
MDIRAAAIDELATVAADAVIVLIAGNPLKIGAHLTPAFNKVLKEASASGDLSAQLNQLYVYRPTDIKAPRLLFRTIEQESLSKAPSKEIRQAMSASLQFFKKMPVKHLIVKLVGFESTETQALQLCIAALFDTLYVYRHTKTSAPKASSLAKITFAVGSDFLSLAAAKKIITQSVEVAAGVELARECANRPANYCTPTFLAEQAQELGRTYGFKVDVLDKKAVEKLKMGAFLAVAQGSSEPLKFIAMHYQGAARTQAPIVLVGKGITFDTGGISIKPAADMDEMKYDMGGAASVLGTLRTVAALKLKLNVIGLIPTCENMPSGNAVKPGDVVTSMSGKTIEILNTDAEGRLILCDALTYAHQFKPAFVIDIATLTGACVIALGHQHTGLFCDDPELAQSLLKAGEKAFDTAWQMPLNDEYAEGLKSNFADLGNVGPRAGGAITAAVFLKQFTQKIRWAHLDIAGTAWRSGGTKKGATGRPVGLLTQFLLARSQNQD